MAFFAAVLVAGRSYLVCRTTHTVLDSCCAGERQEKAPTADVASCCDVLTHAAPGDAIQPTADAQVTSHLLPSLGAPLAIIAPSASSRDFTRALPDWTGPPLDQRRARLSVFLL